MRIGLEVSSTQFNAAGTARYSVELARALCAGKFDDCEIIELRAGTRPVPHPGLARKLFVLWWEWVYCPLILPRRVQQLRLDLLHCTTPMPLGPLAEAVLVTSLHDVIAFSHPQWFSRVMGWRLRRWTGHASRQSAHVIASSHYTARQIGAHLGTDSSRISVVYLGKAIPSKVAEAKVIAEPFLLAVGTLEPRKNLRVTLEAYARARSRLPVLPPLVIVGRQGWGEVRLREWLSELGLVDHVRLAGSVTDQELFALYRSAVVLLYPSLQEGFGFPPLEAMACGCPVIASNTSSLPEVVGEAGLLVDPTNPETLAESVLRLFADPPLAERLRSDGYARAAKFSWERCAHETVVVYRQVLGK